MDDIQPPAQALTNVIDPTGEVVAIPNSQVAEAINTRGYRPAAPQDVAQHFKEEEFSTLPQQALTGLEGVGEGVAGPLFTAAEKATGLTTPENMLARREINPITHGVGQGVGFVGSALAGVGEAPLLEMAGKGVAETLGLAEPVSAMAKVAAGGAKASTEMALMQAGDEGSKMLMNDPNSSFQSAISSVGLAAALGAGGGAAFGAVNPLWKATVGEKLGQFVEDFKGRIEQHLGNPDPAGMLRNELDAHYQGIKGLADEVYGAPGLKEKEIQKLMPAMHEGIGTQTQKINEMLQKTMDGLADDPHLKMFQRAVEKYQSVISNPIWEGDKAAGEIFSATQKLKQQLQEWGQFSKIAPPPLADREFVNTSKSLSFELRNALEDPAVWGKAAERQQAINGAFKEYLPALKDFESKFTSWVGDERVIDPGKINTYVNQLGKPNAELKQEMLENFLNASEKYKNVIDKTHTNLGIESPFQQGSLQAAKASIEKMTPGAKAADALIKRGLAGVAGKGLGTAIGAAGGSLLGHGWLGAIIGEHALGPFFSTILPSLVKPMLGSPADGEALKGAIDYGMAVARGQRIMTTAAKGVFKPGAEVLSLNLIPTEKSRNKLIKRMDDINKNPKDAFDDTDKFGHYLPGHAGAKGQAVGAALEYLNAAKPKPRKVTLMDKEREPSAHEKAEYNKTLDMAQQPALIFKKIKDGTITSRDISLLKTIYPAFYSQAAAKLHDQLLEHLSKDQTVPYTTRIGLAKFFGEPLDSTMQPFNLASIQQTMATMKSKPMPPPGTPNATPGKAGALKKAPGQMQTQQQASEARHTAQF